MLQSHIKIALFSREVRIVVWKTEYLTDWMKSFEWLNDFTVTGYRISIYEKTGIIKFETKVHQGYQFCGEEYLLGLNFELKSDKTAGFMKIALLICRLVRYRGK